MIWVAVNKSIDDFKSEIVPGMVLEVIEDGATFEILVGDCSAAGGCCDCCCMFGNQFVLRYFMLDWETK